VVRNTPGVTGFVGMAIPRPPYALKRSHRSSNAWKPKRPHQGYLQGGRAGTDCGWTLQRFRGTVAEIDMERSKVRVMVNFFGREPRLNSTSCSRKA